MNNARGLSGKILINPIDRKQAEELYKLQHATGGRAAEPLKETKYQDYTLTNTNNHITYRREL